MKCSNSVDSKINYKVYTCTDHEGHYAGVASVIVASSEKNARDLLRQALYNKGLDDDSFTLQELDTGKEGATVLCDGDY